MADQVRASHILIPWEGSASAAGDVSRSQAQALEFINGLASEVSGGTDFGELAKQHSS